MALGLILTWAGVGASVPITFQLDWRANARFAGLFVAQAKGWFRDAGLDVEFVASDSTSNSVARVLSGVNWIGCSESGLLLQAAAAGAPVKAFGAMLQGSPWALLSLPGGGLTNFASLKGRRIGLHPGARPVFQFAIQTEGFATEDFKVTEREGDLIGPLLQGQFDAVEGSLFEEAVRVQAPPSARSSPAADHGVRQLARLGEWDSGASLDVLPLCEHGYVAYSEAYFCNEGFWNNHRGALRTFLSVARRGWLDAAFDPEAAARTVVARFAPGMDEGYVHRSLERVIDFAVREGGLDGLGAMQRSTWQAAIDGLRRQGSVMGLPDLDRMLDEGMALRPPWTDHELGASSAYQERDGRFPLPMQPARLTRRRGRLWVAVAEDGRPVRAVVATPTAEASADREASAWVMAHWRWPSGPARRYLVPLPLAAKAI